jgi:hypothetical protein
MWFSTGICFIFFKILAKQLQFEIKNLFNIKKALVLPSEKVQSMISSVQNSSWWWWPKSGPPA